MNRVIAAILVGGVIIAIVLLAAFCAPRPPEDNYPPVGPNPIEETTEVITTPVPEETTKEETTNAGTVPNTGGIKP